jgi:hypothetical protein
VQRWSRAGTWLPGVLVEESPDDVERVALT